MANALQEALLKAGLVTEEDAKKADKEKDNIHIRGRTADLIMLDEFADFSRHEEEEEDDN